MRGERRPTLRHGERLAALGIDAVVSSAELLSLLS